MEKIMSNSEATSTDKEKVYEVITYEDEVEFKYTLPDDDTPQVMEHELTFIWEDTAAKFIEEFGADKPYKINSFKLKQHYDFFIHQVESRTDDLIEGVEEDIANKGKYGFEFTGQLHNDD